MEMFRRLIRAAGGNRATIPATNRPRVEPLERRTLMNAGAADSFDYGVADASARAITPPAPDLCFDLHHAPQSTPAGDLGRAVERFAPPVDFIVNNGKSPASDDGVLVGKYTAGAFVTEAPAAKPMQRGTVAGEKPAADGVLGSTSTHRFAGRPPATRGEARPLPTRARGRVLVVEDDAASRTALSAILRHRGWEVTVAATLAEGIRQLAKRPDRAIVDLMLPDGDGGRLLEYVRAQGLPTRVTVTTGVKDPSRLERIRRLGAASLLSKPIDVAELLRGLSLAA